MGLAKLVCFDDSKKKGLFFFLETVVKKKEYKNIVCNVRKLMSEMLPLLGGFWTV